MNGCVTPAITVSGIEKGFRLYHDKSRSLKEFILFRGRHHYEKRKVLHGISFTISKGEVVGLIGKNGSGKSTLLKLLTRIMYPNQGSITVNGKVSSLIELGAGFHPDMTGRENIYVNASIFGLKKREIDARMQTIIDFSELAEHIDSPVRTYSSGMYARLAFAVAINVSAEVLLVDEILAVGDAAFQAKCFQKMDEIKAAGTTIVIVSHSLSNVVEMCDRVLWLDNGVIAMDGSPLQVVNSYLTAEGQKPLRQSEGDEIS